MVPTEPEHIPPNEGDEQEPVTEPEQQEPQEHPEGGDE